MVKTTNGAVTSLYFYNALGEMVSELDGSAYTDFIYAPAGALADSPEARVAAVAGGGISPILYFHTDALGTTRAVTNANGNNIANCGQNANHPNGSFLTYAPYGAEVGGCAQSATPFKFNGKYRDAESGLDDFGARFYYPPLGRFLAPDNHGGRLDDPQSLNLYAYARSNPAAFRRSRRA